MKKRTAENPLLVLIFGYGIPYLILTKMSGPTDFGPAFAMILATAISAGYMIFDLIKRRELSYISCLSLIGILLTGAFGLFKLPAQWMAVKEATIPTIIGMGLLLSMRTSSPLVRRLIYNDSIINVDLVEEKLHTSQLKEAFDRLFTESSYLLAGAFLISAVLHYVLAHKFLLSPPGTPEFNVELGQMKMMSWPVISLPMMVVMTFAFYRLMKGIQKLTGLEMEQLMKSQQKSSSN